MWKRLNARRAVFVTRFLLATESRSGTNEHVYVRHTRFEQRWQHGVVVDRAKETEAYFSTDH
jgi:hypothetical protein